MRRREESPRLFRAVVKGDARARSRHGDEIGNRDASARALTQDMSAMAHSAGQSSAQAHARCTKTPRTPKRRHKQAFTCSLIATRRPTRVGLGLARGCHGRQHCHGHSGGVLDSLLHVCTPACLTCASCFPRRHMQRASRHVNKRVHHALSSVPFQWLSTCIIKCGRAAVAWRR